MILGTGASCRVLGIGCLVLVMSILEGIGWGFKWRVAGDENSKIQRFQIQYFVGFQYLMICILVSSR